MGTVKILYAAPYTPNSTLIWIQLFDMMVCQNVRPPAFVSKNSYGEWRWGPGSDVTECVNDTCGDITMILYIISKNSKKG